MGRGQGRRQGANDAAFKANAEKSGFPPDSPNVKPQHDFDEQRRIRETLRGIAELHVDRTFAMCDIIRDFDQRTGPFPTKEKKDDTGTQ